MELWDYKNTGRRQLLNLKEEFWFRQFQYEENECPYCEQSVKMMITITKKSVRIACSNEQCKKVFFYRVNLGRIE